MNEEAKMILEMLREGKITADEASRLLHAVRPIKEPPLEEEGTLFRELRDTANEVVGRVRKEAKEAIRRANEALQNEHSGSISQARAIAHQARDEVREQVREAKARLKEMKRELKRRYQSSNEDASLARREQETRERVQEETGDMAYEIEEVQEELEEAQDELDQDAEQVGLAELETEELLAEPAEGVWTSVEGTLRGERTYHWQENLSGELPDVPVPHIVVRGVSGRITVECAGDNKWHLAVEKSARAGDANQAQSLSRGLYSVETTAAGLVIAAKRVFGQRRAVNFRLRLPQELVYDLDLSAVNGSVGVKDVAAKRIRASTTNGQVAVESNASDINLSSVNGRVDLTGGAASVQCRTVNGSMVVTCPTLHAGTLSLDTVNGNITLRLGNSKDVGVRIKGGNVHGSVQAEGLGLRVDVVPHTIGKKLLAESQGVFSQWLEVHAKSVHGSINITPAT